MIELSPDQQHALKAIMEWHRAKSSPYITLGGYAGTGKTTLIAELRKQLHENYPKLNVSFCSYTGKAARVLKTKIQEADIIKAGDTVSTIHGLIYSPIVNDKEEITGWMTKETIDTGLIIVDEASMVDGDIWRDLLKYNIPILAVGDHGQLPPIKGEFNLMTEPMITLTHIHRQALDNPIIRIAQIARETGQIPAVRFGHKVRKVNRQTDIDAQDIVGEALNRYHSDTLVLCGFNHTRIKLNKHIRQTREFESDKPVRKDRVICLRNNHAQQVYNGMLGTILSISDHDKEWYKAEIEMDGEYAPYSGLIYKDQFNNVESMNFGEKRARLAQGDIFDFGYALTVHKAQGSQARKVVLFEERFKQMDDATWRRWLYTAVTRAEEELLIIG